VSRSGAGQDTRSRLLAAAEALFAERGTEAVSLREIGRAAGARNVMAAQYWFGDRDGLIRALLDRHRPGIESRRHALLDCYQTRGHDDVHALAGALVRPLAPELEQGAGGAGYLRAAAELLTRPEPSLEPLHLGDPGSSLVRWSRLLEPLLDPAAVELHRRFLTMRFVAVEFAQRARAAGRRDHRLFVSQLVDVAAGLLSAGVSERTRRIQAERRAERP
jgi:AcrR family transcriptional regulator